MLIETDMTCFKATRKRVDEKKPLPQSRAIIFTIPRLVRAELPRQRAPYVIALWLQSSLNDTPEIEDRRH